MYSEITTTIRSPQAVFNLVKATHGPSNSSELLTAMTDISIKLTDGIARELAREPYFTQTIVSSFALNTNHTIEIRRTRLL